MPDTSPRKPRFPLQMPDHLREKVEKFAEDSGMSRNAAINFLCGQALTRLEDRKGARR